MAPKKAGGSKSKKRSLDEAKKAQKTSDKQQRQGRTLDDQLKLELVKFFKELDDIADEEKAAFLQVRDKNPALLEEESPPERFLLCETSKGSTFDDEAAERAGKLKLMSQFVCA